MEKKLVELINNEDKKNPLSDNEIAEKLSISRYDVLKLRKKLDIQDYSARRLPCLSETIIDILNMDNEISNVELTRKVEEQGYNVSRFLVAKLRDELLKKVNRKSSSENKDIDIEEPANLVKPIKKYNSLTESVVGYNGSIEYQINQAIAAVKYPPNGLHTLILGQTGTGKSYLAEIMFQIAKEAGKITQNSSLIKLNCADYANNPQLLLSQLFGYVKGAFTGADTFKTGLIEKANNGILFLDEIHRLPLEGQEILFSVMDNGVYRRLGQSENEEKVNVMIVGATTEDVDSHLLATFRRRIPMIIELPPLSNRPIDERYKIILNFLKNEAVRIGTKIHMKSEAMCALLLYDCIGNIGQLKSDIQVSCARAYLKYLNEGSKYVTIDISDFNVYVQKSLLRNKYSNDDISKYLDKGVIITPDEADINILDEVEPFVLPDNIYKFIDERFEVLKQQGITEKLVYNIVGKELDIKFERAIKHINANLNQNYERKNIVKLVGESITETVELMVSMAENILGPLNKSLTYCLSLHLYESIRRIKENKVIINPELERIRKTHILEYSAASDMIKSAEERLNIKFPEDEIGFITMYLKANMEYFSNSKSKVKIIIITHGSVALEISKFVNKILNYDFVEAVCMPLDENPEVTLKRTVELAKKINERGIMLLVDMGSLLTFGELITKETGIPTKTVGRVDLVMALETAIKAKNGGVSLEELYALIESKSKHMTRLPREININKNKVIVTLCITGHGAAISIKKIVEDLVPELSLKGIDIIPVGIIGENSNEYIKKIQAEKEVIAIVGTIDPRIDGIKFLPIETIMQENGLIELKNIISKTEVVEAVQSEFTDVIFNELIVTKADYTAKEEAIHSLGKLLFKCGFVKEGYLPSLNRRESLIPTSFINGIAIPHTYPKHVNKPAIAIATLKKPVKWSEDYYADIIFMLALGYQNGSVLKNLYRIANNNEFINKIKGCENSDKLMGILKEELSKIKI